MRANVGVIAGYVAHAVLGALGVAAVVATSPSLFEALRWTGIAYLSYLAIQMLRSALKPGNLALHASPRPASLCKGFLTSFLNPKGLMVYFSILPNFMTVGDDVAVQALALSAVLVALCAVVYGMVGYVVAASGASGGVNGRARRIIEGFAVGMLALVAVHVARP